MGCLSHQLDAFLDGLLDRLDPDCAGILRRAEEARAAHLRQTPSLRVGDIAPDFTLPDQARQPVSLYALLDRGPVVLSFFRGGWCPFCTITLRAMERLRPALERKGAALLMVSPQSAAQSAATARRQFLQFPLLTDAGNHVAGLYGVAARIDPEQQMVMRRLGHDLSLINDDAPDSLPLPVGYVIRPDRRIAHAHADGRVNRRLEPATALAVLQELVAEQVT